MDAASLIAKARKMRDDSIAEITPPLAPLPEPLPKNVMNVYKDVLSEEEIKITSYDAPELLQAIREKAFSCEAVTRAFLRRAALAQKLVAEPISAPAVSWLYVSFDLGICVLTIV